MKINKKTGFLIKNFIIYFFGTVVSKLLNIAFLPLITIYLSVSEFGYYDLILTTIGLLVPVFTLQTIDAVFRFLFDATDEKKKSVLSNVWMIIAAGTMVFISIVFLINYFIFRIDYVYYILIYYLMNVIINMYQRISRSYGMNMVFTMSGIIQTILLLIFEFIFLIFFHMRVNGMLLAYIISSFISCVYLEVKVHAIKDIKIKSVNINDILMLIKFSLPLVPNNICWWATASINKYIIYFYLGQSANGLYAITLKFASIITMVTAVFSLAWQESSIIEYEDNDRKEYISSVFNNYFSILMMSTYIIVLGLKLIYKYIVADDFYDSWVYLPITLLGTVFTSVSSFYGSGYLAAKKTKGAFYSTIISALINIVICWILVRYIGIMAAPVASLIAYLALWILRHYTMKSFYEVKVNIGLISMLIIFFMFITYLYYFYGFVSNLICLIIVTILFIVYAIKVLKNIILNNE